MMDLWVGLCFWLSAMMCLILDGIGSWGVNSTYDCVRSLRAEYLSSYVFFGCQHVALHWAYRSSDRDESTGSMAKSNSILLYAHSDSSLLILAISRGHALSLFQRYY